MFTQVQIRETLERWPEIVDYPSYKQLSRHQKAVLIVALRNLWIDPVDHKFYGLHRPLPKDIMEFQYAIAIYDLNPVYLVHG